MPFPFPELHKKDLHRTAPRDVTPEMVIQYVLCVKWYTNKTDKKKLTADAPCLFQRRTCQLMVEIFHRFDNLRTPHLKEHLKTHTILYILYNLFKIGSIITQYWCSIPGTALLTFVELAAPIRSCGQHLMRIENCSSPMWDQGLGISMVSNSTIHAPQVNA